MFFCTVDGSFPRSQFLRIDPIPFILTAQKTGSRNSSLCTNGGFDQKMSIHKTLICRKLFTPMSQIWDIGEILKGSGSEGFMDTRKTKVSG